MLRVQALEIEQDSAGLQRLKFRREGWSRWKWDGHDIHYVKAGVSCAPCAGIAAAVVPRIGRRFLSELTDTRSHIHCR